MNTFEKNNGTAVLGYRVHVVGVQGVNSNILTRYHPGEIGGLQVLVVTVAFEDSILGGDFEDGDHFTLGSIQ